ncbi:hypothetical protein ACPXCX_45935, partial [Streptomyces sp. DT225]
NEPSEAGTIPARAGSRLCDLRLYSAGVRFLTTFADSGITALVSHFFTKSHKVPGHFMCGPTLLWRLLFNYPGISATFIV